MMVWYVTLRRREGFQKLKFFRCFSPNLKKDIYSYVNIELKIFDSLIWKKRGCSNVWNTNGNESYNYAVKIVNDNIVILQQCFILTSNLMKICSMAIHLSQYRVLVAGEVKNLEKLCNELENSTRGRIQQKAGYIHNTFTYLDHFYTVCMLRFIR